MRMPRDPSDPIAEGLDDGMVDLLVAARLLFAAAGEVERRIGGRPIDENLDQQLFRADLKILLWQIVALLPPGLRLDTDKSSQDQRPGQDHVLARADLSAALQAAARELRRVRLRAQPAGTSALLTDLTVLIARLDAMPPSQTIKQVPE